MWHQQWHTSRDKSFQAFPRFSYCKQQKLDVEAWERGYLQTHANTLGTIYHQSTEPHTTPEGVTMAYMFNTK